MANETAETGCCPRFNPEPWDDKVHEWKDKLFARGDVCQLFHIPLNMGKVVTGIWTKIQAAEAAVPTDEFLMLAYDPSPWKSELYFAVAKKPPDVETTTLSGTFISKVFEGPFNAVPKWMKEMEAFVAAKGKRIKKQYFYYTTCPKVREGLRQKLRGGLRRDGKLKHGAGSETADNVTLC